MQKLISLLTLLSAAAFAEPNEGRLMRFPDVHGDRIVFSYGGDLWLAPRAGGTAHRITTHPGQELFGKFSPDGKWIAFTAQYDGNYNVYVMPSEGGDPRQLTFHPGGAPISERMGIHNEIINWTPDSKSIVFLSRRDTYNGWFGRLYVVDIAGGMPEAFPLDKGGLTSFSPDGTKIAYNRIFRNFRTWKRYTGGMAQDITIFDLGTHASEVVPHTAWTDTFPMWHGNTIYFSSDRGPEHKLNLWAYDVGSKQVAQITHFTDWDVMWPSLGPDGIVFENAGYLYTWDFKGDPKKLTIFLPGDRELARAHRANVKKLITDFDISPDGKRAVVTARGDIFTVPAKEGSIRDLTRTPGAREKYAAWSPDGRWIAYFSDRTGEDELYVSPQDGIGGEIRITNDGKVFRLPPQWSPDSRKLLFSDKDNKLFYVDVDERKPVQIDQGHYADLTDYSWSPDSRWVTYAKAADNRNDVIYLYNLGTKKSTEVTDSSSESRAPYFDPEGKFLYFISDRDYNEVLGNFDFEFANPKTGRVYVVTLKADEPSPFPVLSDEVTTRRSPDVLLAPVPLGEKPTQPPEAATKKPPKPEEKGAGKTAAEEKKEEEQTPGTRPLPKNFRIDLEGIQHRIVALPIPPGNLQGLTAAKGVIYYVTAPISGLSGPLPGETAAIHGFDLKSRKDHIVLEGANLYALSFDGKKILYRASKGGGGGGEGGGHGDYVYGIVDAKVPSDDKDKPEAEPKALHHAGEGALKLDELKMEVDPPAEWRQMFEEVWRQERDYFFEPSMNGVDWPAIRKKYEQLLPYVADRLSLTYVLGEMIGELSNSHTYVGGGDYPDLDAVNVGLLGADLVPDRSGFYRITKIYPGENWDRALRSPLTEPGVNVKEGEYLLAVNGRALKEPQNPYQLFIDTVNQATTITVNAKPSFAGARNVVVRPIPSEFGLHELNMIETNRRKVAEATGGRVGYVYLPDMGGRGLNAFVKQYFPQIRKQGMIFDVRYNGGGFVDQIIFERLRRVVAGMDAARNFEIDTVPGNTFYGAMACVTNHYAASDGDLFSYYWKVYKLGPLIGTRTWGGVRGIRGNIPLMDGGYITRPEFARYGMHSEWVIENHGVEPDVEVDNPPGAVLAGHDPQLETAIKMVLDEMEKHPKKLPPRPPDLPPYPPEAGASH